MLKGLEVTEVNVQEIDFSDRIDAEYFSRVDLQIQSKLRQKGASELRDFCDFVASAFYPAATQLYEIGDTPFVRCVDCISHPIITHDQDDTFEKIPRAFIEENKGVSFLGRNDIVLTKVGTPCFASLIGEHEYVALSRTVMGLQSVHDIDPRYLMVFLRSRYGFAQLMRQRELTIQYQLTLERVKRILVYRPDARVEKAICSIVDRYQEIVSRSRRTYQEAEDLLRNELGFANWNPTHGGVSTKPFSEVTSVGRIDAEYFQPKFDAIEAKIRARFSDIVCASEFLVEGLCKSDDDKVERYIELADIGVNGTVESCTKAEFADLPSRARQRVSEGQVIVSSIEGSLKSCALITSDFDGALCSTGFHRFQTDKINPETLLLLFKSWPIQELLKRGCSGTILSGISADSLEDIPLPILPQRVQSLLADKVRESFRLRNESKRFLDLAKFAVELAIEKGEDTALSYMMHKGT